MYVNKLKELITPPENPVGVGDLQNRKIFEKKLGIKLPTDYYHLLETYGAGYFGGYFIVYNPFVEHSGFDFLYMLNENRYFYTMMKDDFSESKTNLFIRKFRTPNGKYKICGGEADSFGFPFPFYPEEGGLLPCCEFEGEYTVYWKTGGDKWTIVVYDCDEFYSEFDMSLTQFLYNLATEKIHFGELYNCFTQKGLIFEKYVEDE